MPNDEGFMTREEFQETYGVDPLEEQQKQERGTLARYGGNIAVGVGSAIPSILALPETAYAGAKGLINSYANDTPFMDEFTKAMQVEGAQEQIQAHLQNKLSQITASGASQEDAERQLEEYQNSKEFEDFTHTLFKGGIGLSVRWQDTLHNLVGDKRTEAQKDWTDSASEILGGALVGGPRALLNTPTKIASQIASKGVTGAALRGVAKTVELTTPVTVPYTAPNVVANAAVGTALDQGIRYAQGKDTAFTPKDDQSPGVSTLIGSAYAVAGMASFVAAMRGAQKAKLQINTKNEVQQMIDRSPRLSEQVSPEATNREAVIVSGREQQLNPESAIDERGDVRAYATRARGQLFDRQAPGRSILDEVAPEFSTTSDIQSARWRQNEALFAENTGPVLADQVNQSTELAMRPVLQALEATAPENRGSIQFGMAASTIKSRYDRVEDALVTKMANIEKANPKKFKDSAAWQDANDKLTRLLNDKDATARIITPETARSVYNKAAINYETGKHPDLERMRTVHTNWAQTILNNEVLAGRMKPTTAKELHRIDPYFVPLDNDPFGGATGLNRIRRIAVQSLKKAQTETINQQHVGYGTPNPIRRFKAEVPGKHENVKQETRITAIRNIPENMVEITRNSYKSLAEEVARREALQLLHSKPDGSVSDFVKQGKMVSVPNPRTGKHWTPAEQAFENADLMRLLDDKMHVGEWKAGDLRVWKFGDVELATLLRNDPVKISASTQNVLTTRNLFKLNTTGALNMPFAIGGAQYNMMLGMLFRPGNRAYGTWSYALQHLPKPVRNVLRAATLDIDPTPIATYPYHVLRNVTNFMAWFGARAIDNKLKTLPQFSAFRQMVGPQTFQNMLNRAAQIASWTENLSTIRMMRGGASRGLLSIDNMENVRKQYALIGTNMPRSMRAAYTFWRGIADSLYLGSSRPYFLQNEKLLARQYGGKNKIPMSEQRTLMHETRTLGGDMSLIPGSEQVRAIEAWFPYLSEAKLGTYHLARHLGNPDLSVSIPTWSRLTALTMAVGAAAYWRTYWDADSRKEYWNRPEYDRYRILDIPTPTLLWKWAQGENPPHSRDLYYSFILPPDVVGIIAGALAIMQEMGMLPQDATPKPIRQDVPNIWINSLTPAMPPLLQAALGWHGTKLDPQGADTRGGNWLRTTGNMFRAGPQSESATNLGQISNSASLVLNATLGAMGSYLAGSTDVLLHAAKFDTSQLGQPIPRSQFDLAAGLKAGAYDFAGRFKGAIRDVPLVWQAPQKERVGTSAWQFVKENDQDIKSIIGMRTELGKAAMRRRQIAIDAGGIPSPVITDPVLIEVANIVNKYQSDNGMLGRLRKEYRDLSSKSRGINAQYNLSHDDKQAAINNVIREQQDNMQQQHLAIKFLEQELGGMYGERLAPYLKGQPLSIKTLEAAMREMTGKAPLEATRPTVE